ncbi:peptide/nickel transport system ATP-binding protein/oligopeptide transport system ATP-binding protein [Bacillus oleivorans]|uniref:Peptide/nickel transport system ATP-binding protein/oligopeptide transport system ATP-binding protein n=1 Tax=Bacillus oleivorans TaxID=1448271 RepID=A0A285D4F2_9BACI|nr:ABC transporter ATP-binding protein [Bacillus oleivorans]SNX74565.1 peptide/nickel transport system ATP-binding protein/oligopeptide transport system ATP-binding protein [Bacillus oleivorans]
MTQQTLLNVEGLKTYFYLDNKKVAKAVDGVNFAITPGETLALVGESGSGKSITSLSIMQLINRPGKIEGGKIIFGGKDLVGLSDKQMSKIRGKDIAMIFQEPMTALNPVFTIGNQIVETLKRHKKLSKKEANIKAIELLKMVGFPRAEETMKEYPHQLSGGMRQRAMIAIAISCDPKLLIADEPTTALDVTIQAQILDLLDEMKKKFNMAVLLITHDLGVVAEYADRVMVMYGGQIVEDTTVERLFTNPKHPYTNGLLESLPSLDKEVDRLGAIKGMVPPAYNFPAGCRFADRCPKAMDQCKDSNPELLPVKPGHDVRCYLYQ